MSNVTTLPTEGLRTPPHNFEAEMALLGAILLNNQAYWRVAEFLRPEHFGDARHALVYEAVGDLILANQIADPITLHSRFKERKALEDIGGSPYIARLATSAVSILNATDYGRTVLDLYQRREMLGLLRESQDAIYGDFEDYPTASDLIERVQQRLFNLQESGAADGGFASLASVSARIVNDTQERYRAGGKPLGLQTGLADLDKKLGGMQPSDLIVLAGRPSMGKTALALSIGSYIAESYRQEPTETGEQTLVAGGVVGFFSLEMSDEQIGTRVIGSKTKVPTERIRRGSVDAHEFQKVIDAGRELEAVPLYIDDSPRLTIQSIRSRARRLKRTKGLHLLIVDYLQLISSAGRQENRVQEISAITRGLKMLAKELNVPVLALSQLSRAVEQRDNKRPVLSDLRDSGSIEQDADVVMLIYRDRYYHTEAPTKQRGEDEGDYAGRMAKWRDDENVAEIIIGKQRNGPTGIVEAYFNASTSRFSNLIKEERMDF